MGDFTSKYKVTYGNGTSQTESRVDSGKVFDNAIAPIFLLVLAVIALIAAIPFLLVIPVLLYIYTPYKKVKGLLKSNENIKDYSDEFLASKGYKTFGTLASSIKIKFYLVVVLILVACGFIDYYMFTNYELNKLGKFAMTMLVTSLPILVVYPLALLLFFKNRKVLFELLDHDSTVDSVFGQRFYRFGQRLFSLILRQKKKLIFLALLPMATYFAHHFYFEYQAGKEYKYVNFAYELYEEKPTKQNIAKIKESMEQESIGINDSFYGNTFLYNIAYYVDELIEGKEFYKDEYYLNYNSLSKKYKTCTILEIILMNSLGAETYTQNYKNISNKLTIYTKLGGDINIKNSTTQTASLENIISIEAFYAAKKLGANFDGVKYDVIVGVIDELGAKDKGYSKRLANLIRDIKPSSEVAQEVLSDRRYRLKSDRQISALKVLEKIAD